MSLHNLHADCDLILCEICNILEVSSFHQFLIIILIGKKYDILFVKVIITTTFTGHFPIDKGVNICR